MKQRAIADADKELRRQSLLENGRRLFLENPRQLPTVAAIADACGLAKGTVYLYFKSKEEIFIALLAEEFAGLFARITRALSATPPGAGREMIAAFSAAYTDYLKERPEFLRLAAMANSVLEQSVSPAIVFDFKSALARGLGQTGSIVETLTGLPPGQGARLLMNTYALTLGLWQACDVPPELEALLAAPELKLLRPDFQQDLSPAIAQLWQGALQQG